MKFLRACSVLSKIALTLALLAASMLALAGCENMSSQNSSTGIDPSATDCTAGLAQIQVGDGFLQVLCGCTSSATGAGVVVGAPIASPGDFTCTVPSGTIVMWQVPGVQLWHQIVSVPAPGQLTFPSGQLIQPGSADTTSVAQFTASGTYEFQDAMNNGLQGEIIVP